MTVITLTEHGAAVSLPLDDAVGRALVASRLAEAAPDPYVPGRWRLRAKGKVGVVRVTASGGAAATMRIVPKVPIHRLLFLLGYALDPKGWREEDVTADAEPDLLPALARLFERQADKALRQGLLQGYRSVEETSLLLRGRIREADQIRRHHGRSFPIEIIHDEYTPDIAENRLLRTACDRLLRLPSGVPRDVRIRLLRLRVRLADITPVGRGHALPEWRPSRLNVRYRPALRLASLVLAGASVEHRPGDVTVSGFLFDMAKVFEDFVTISLREALAPSGRCVLQGSVHLDEDRAIRIIPDLVHRAADGTPLAVADAKYKAEKPEGFPDADLYQMLAYCTALGLRNGHLIYAKGNAPHAVHRVRHAGVLIHQHALELDQAPAGLLAEVRSLAGLLVPDQPFVSSSSSGTG
ncbi:McrC family protein [Thermomonospora umbrina]|uniref:5-methylcytosine-specific restriction enzyme subunit McrC n=1 Tax=Thermomonospora umbrina TaxID=111806 RepID=A0A3D9SQG4_9ACTN|nr:restriction endonuclease [Thermomonospora umbrina]REE98216.1 5-methylcytosine-specific restriction enzyme subunit McrC [Thermomonospora umbrina]